MWQYLLQSRSKYYYDDEESGGGEPSWDWSFFPWLPIILLFMFLLALFPYLYFAWYLINEMYSMLKKTVTDGKLSYPFLAKAGIVVAIILTILFFNRFSYAPVHLTTALVLAIGFVFIFTILPILALCLHWILKFHSFLNARLGNFKLYSLYIVCLGLILAVIICHLNSPRSPVLFSPPPTESLKARINSEPVPTLTALDALPNRSVTIIVDDFSPQPYQGEAVYFFNRLEGDRGAINNSIMDWGDGQVTTAISQGNSWGGVWMSLNHPIREGLPINFSAILPAQILPAYQSQITGITVHIADGTPNKTFKLELKNGNLSWKEEAILNGGKQVLDFNLPALGNINQLVWVLDRASEGDYVTLDSVSFTAETPLTDTATAAFVWSYGMLLNNWNPATGLVRDKAKDASGEFDAIQATGSLSAATTLAEQIGVVDHVDAVTIVDKISDTLLNKLPRNHGLWPHWVKTSPDGKIEIVPNTEWSSVDTSIAALGLLGAQQSLGLDTSGTEAFLQEIEWENLVTDKGISHGYTYDDILIPYAWDVFGGESWLVELAYASATGKVSALAYPSPPTANGSGFIDELAWLFVPPPSNQDYWGTEWKSYRLAAATNQISYYPTNSPASCFPQLGLFGLSAGEVPSPSVVTKNSIYQAYGIGGAFGPANDGSALGAPVVAPHYSAMIASLRPEEAIKMWDWLIKNGYFSPLNNVESLTFSTDSNCHAEGMQWNHLKGSWNLSLQTLGWGRYLTERDGHVPVLWQAAVRNQLLYRGYALLTSSVSTPTAWVYERECENLDEGIGTHIWRSNASGSAVQGQFGAISYSPWPAQSGYVRYSGIDVPQTADLYLKLRYSKHSPALIPILIYIDYESTPRTTIQPVDQGDWNQFTWTEPMPLGNIRAGPHSIRFYTDGQQYGTADLDMFILTMEHP